MLVQLSFRALTLTLTLTLAAALTLSACCERPQPEKSKVTAVTVAPATPPATPPAADRYPATLAEGIDFTKPGYPEFIAEVTGMSGHEPWGRWSDGGAATFQLAQPLPSRFILIITAHAFGPNIGTPIKVKAGASEQTLTLTTDDQTYRLDFTLAAPTDRLEFLIPQPTSPADLKQSEDPRKLGVGFVKLQLETDAAPAASATPSSGPVYAATLAASTDRLELEQGGFATVTFTLTNRGSLPWASEPPNPVNLAWHLFDSDGKMLQFDNPRTAFSQPVAAGQTVTLDLKLGADQFPGPGHYRLEFDLVHENQTWFANEGSPTLTIPVTVKPLKKSRAGRRPTH